MAQEKNDRLRVDLKKLTEKTTSVKQTSQFISRKTEELSEVYEKLKNEWRGEASVEFLNDLNLKITELRETNLSLTNTLKSIEKVCSMYLTCEKNSEEIVDALCKIRNNS